MENLQDLYADQTYFAKWEIDEETGERVPAALGQPRWPKNGSRYPLWADSPTELLSPGFIRLKIVRPSAVVR